MEKERLDDQTVALRAAKEFQDGMIVNLGVGIPTLCSNFVPPEREILFQSENGVLGFGPIVTDADLADVNLINAGVQPVSAKAGMSIFDHAESFAMIRGGHVDIAVLGAIQVSEKGDLANWLLPGKQVGSLGGGMDLAFCARKVIAVTTHTTKAGKPKIVSRCSEPLTAPECVGLIVSDVAVIEVTSSGLVLREVAPGWSAEDVQALTEPRLAIPPDLKELDLA
jgi:3-oxoacid CoA-transferase subunit B